MVDFSFEPATKVETPAVETPVVETPVVETPTVETPAVETPIETPAAETTFDYSKFGVSSAEELQQKWDSLNNVAKEYDSRRADVETFLSIKDQLENPYADESIARINEVVKQLGIKDVVTASEIVNISPELLAKNPIEALMYERILENPAILTAMTKSEIRQAIAEKYNLSLDDMPETLPALLKMDASSAALSVSKKVEALKPESNNPYLTLSQQRQQSQQTAAEYRAKMEQVVDTAVSQLTQYEEELRGHKITIPVEESDRAEIKKALIQFAHTLPSNHPNPQGAIEDYRTSLVQAMKEAQRFEAFEKMIAGREYEKAKKEFHNGGQVTRTDKPDDKPKEVRYEVGPAAPRQ